MLSKDLRSRLRKSILNHLGDTEQFYADIVSPEYLVSNLGKVYSSYTKRLLKPSKNDKGYYSVKIYSNGTKTTVSVHVLVARNFLNNFEYEVNHISGDKSDNRLQNLELLTRRENVQHAKDIGLLNKRKGKDSPSFVFTSEIVDNMIKDRNNGMLLKHVAVKYGTSQSYACTMIKQRKENKR